MSTVTFFPAVSSSGGGIQAAWFATTLARIQAYDATLTDIAFFDECAGPKTQYWADASSGTGTVSSVVSSAFDIQSGATSGGAAVLNYIGATPTKIIPNLRTSHYAMAMRVTNIATIATAQNYMTMSDGVGTGIPKLGILGATSTTNYTVKCGTTAAVDTGVAQSAVGTYDTLIMVCDGTNMKIDINGAAPGAGASQAIGASIVTSQGYPALAAVTGANANTGIRVDKVLVVIAPAS